MGGIYGYSHTCGGYDGGQAEYVRVPFADIGPSVIPEWMDDEDAVLLTDALAARRRRVRPGAATVVVNGATRRPWSGSCDRPTAATLCRPSAVAA